MEAAELAVLRLEHCQNRMVCVNEMQRQSAGHWGVCQKCPSRSDDIISRRSLRELQEVLSLLRRLVRAAMDLVYADHAKRAFGLRYRVYDLIVSQRLDVQNDEELWYVASQLLSSVFYRSWAREDLAVLVLPLADYDGGLSRILLDLFLPVLLQRVHAAYD